MKEPPEPLGWTPNRWSDEWLRYLETEATGARRTLSSWLGLLIALFGVFLATIAGLADVVDPSLLASVASFFVWALLVVLITTYVWYQYLGTVRSISRKYISKDEEHELLGPKVPGPDFWEVATKDVGSVLNFMFGRLDYLRKLRKPESEVREMILAPMVLFWMTLALSILAILAFVADVLQAASISIAPFVFTTAMVSSLVYWTQLRKFLRRVAGIYRELRESDAKESLQ